MNVYIAALLGVIQGLTEFLPISSSGHLVLAEHQFAFIRQPGATFEAFLHAGTLISILVFFNKDLKKFAELNFLKLIVVASLPAALVGFFFRDFIEALFSNVYLVGGALIITGLINYASDCFSSKESKLTFKDSVFVGIFQALAIIPGISRSGSTIFAAVKRGIKRSDAARFSFFLSIPAVIGANIVELVAHPLQISNDLWLYLVGLIFAFLSGLLAIKITLTMLAKKNFSFFAYYCFILGLLVLFLY